MSELIAIVIFFGSLVGMGVIIFRKIPFLLTLPEIFPQKENFILKLVSKLKEKLKKINPFQNFSYEIFFAKILTKIRILSLKVDHYAFNLSQKLKIKAKEKHLNRVDEYWEKIKKEMTTIGKKLKKK